MGATDDGGRHSGAISGVVRGRHALAGHKATIKNDPPFGGGISTIGDGSLMVFCVFDKQCRCIIQVRIHALSSSVGSWDRQTAEGGGDGNVVDISDG